MTRDQQRQVLSAAAHWVAQLAAAPDDAALQGAWQQWRRESPDHQWAWQRVELLQAQLNGVPGPLAYNVLDKTNDRAALLDRRTVLKSLLLLAGAGTLGWSSYQRAPVWLADQRTAVGERRTLNLADGTRVVLNTATAIDVRFDAQLRLITLGAGEILVETGKDARPFIVHSAEGAMRALGTRFTVRQEDGMTQLGVLEHAVAVRPLSGTEEQIVAAGNTVGFSRSALGTSQPVEPGEGEWSKGHLVIDGWRLDRMLAELQRYRSGYLGCDPAVAGLTLSGAYPLDDIDRALAAVARALPVKVMQRTRFWTRITAIS